MYCLEAQDGEGVEYSGMLKAHGLNYWQITMQTVATATPDEVTTGHKRSRSVPAFFFTASNTKSWVCPIETGCQVTSVTSVIAHNAQVKSSVS